MAAGGERGGQDSAQISQIPGTTFVASVAGKGKKGGRKDVEDEDDEDAGVSSTGLSSDLEVEDQVRMFIYVFIGSMCLKQVCGCQQHCAVQRFENRGPGAIVWFALYIKRERVCQQQQAVQEF